MTRDARHILIPAIALPLLLALAVALTVPLAPPAAAASTYARAIDITFPVAGLDAGNFTNDYTASRGGGTRVHRATDIGAPDAYGLPVHAARGGRITQMTGVGRAVPSWGYAITIEGDDGRTYNYLHLGRQDGPTSEAYAPGLSVGDEVRRGQHIGYVGHSGNASASWPHLHFEIEDPRVRDPYGSNRLNPYASLRTALDRGDVPGEGFLDVNGGPHADSIAAIAEAEITAGCAVRRYCPATDVTREQMATFLMRALKLPEGSGRPFSDVATSNPHAGAIAALAERGIAKGNAEGRFNPKQRVRRDQMASLLAAAMDLDTTHTASSFPDVKDGSVHAGAIEALVRAEITHGRNGRFEPARPIDRAQMASFLDRAFLG